MKKYRCPFCPDRFATEEKYREHFERMHEYDIISRRHNDYKPPVPYVPPPRFRENKNADLDFFGS
jgi:hypothetical protein